MNFLKGRFLLLAWFLLSFSLSASAEPPIEVTYFKPSDVQTPSQAELDALHEVMIEVQAFFASEMDRHGFGQKTFAFNQDIRVVAGRQTAAKYWDMDTVKNETHHLNFDVQNKIDVIFLAGRKRILGGALGGMLPLCWDWPGKSRDPNDCNYLIVIPTGYKEFLLPITAHEIGHAFGLQHTQNKTTFNRVDIMYTTPTLYEGVKAELKDFAFSRTDAIVLNKTGRLSAQQNLQDSDQEISLNTDVNNDGYTDLSDCLIVRSAMSFDSNYDTDINDDGVTNILDLMLVKAAALEAIAAAAPSKRRIKVTTWGALKMR